MSQYPLGSLVKLTGRFYSDAAKTVLADPTTVTLSIRDPTHTVTTHSVPPVVTDSTGIYTYDWTPSIAGWYEINWAGTGAVVSADQEPVYISVGIDLGQLYISPDQFKATSSMTDTTFADPDITLAIGAASRAVDSLTGRRFWLDADDTQVRYYTPQSHRLLQIDDLVAMSELAIDRTGNGSWSEVWVQGTDYVLEPFNAPSEMPARPYETIRVRNRTGRWLPRHIEQSVKATGQFGWSAIPDDVAAATSILASKLLLRSRSAPFGIVTAGIDTGVAMRIARTDPDVYTLLREYNRHEFAA